MGKSRSKKAKANIVVALGCQVITLVCGLIVPRALIGAFGSEVYGATTSIAQFLAYVTLLEGGIGGVARAALYKPLASNDTYVINEIMAEIRRFFKIVGFIFAAYVLVLACSFKTISNVQYLDWLSTFLLVVVISISTFGQYFIGISNSVLLQAAQKSYVTNAVSICATVVNAVFTIVLIKLGCGIILVKLVSSCIFFLRPVVLWLYVRKIHRISRISTKPEKNYLSQKWSGLGQHIAFFLHSNTDVVVLTCLMNLRFVAVYSVYNMVVSHIQSLTSSFVSGMEAVFGDMLAKGEQEQLHRTFNLYETIISVASVVLFSVTAVLIVPFVRLYTAGITDADYHAPVFAILLILSALCYCLRMPYHSLVIAAGHFKQTSAAAYGEALLNILISVLLVMRYGLVGVAVGTLVATGFRFVYYVVYLSRNIFSRKIAFFLKRILINSASVLVSILTGNFVISLFDISNYLIWAVCGVVVTVIAAIVTIILNFSFYRNTLMESIGHITKRKHIAK